MTGAFRHLSIRHIAVWGFVLNAVWEFIQCALFYDMWDWGFWRGAAWMWGAVFGDVLIVLGVAAVSLRFVETRALALPTGRGWAVLLGVGFVASVGLEWAARALHLWSYNDWMPTIVVLDHTVGLSPIVQITALPALSVYLATRSSRRADEA